MNFLYFLFSLIYKVHFDKWRKEIEEEQTLEIKEEEAHRGELEKMLDENGRKLLIYYTNTMIDRMEDLIYYLNIKTFNLAIQTGMELGREMERRERI